MYRAYTFLRILFLPALFISVFGCQRTIYKSDVLIKNVNIVDIQTGTVTEGQSIAIKNDIIIDIFDANSKTYEAVGEIDATGKYAMPGLWDMHVHFRGGKDLEEFNRRMLPLYIAKGVTSVRDAGGDLTLPVISWKFLTSSRFIVGPRIYTSGPKLDGPDARWEGSLEVSNQEEVNQALDSLQVLGVDYVKLYDSQLSGETYLSAIKETEKRGIKVTGHMPLGVLLDDAIEAGVDGIEHMYYIMKGCSSKEEEISKRFERGEIGFWAALEQFLETYDEEKAQQVFQKLADNNVAVVPTLYINRVLTYIHEEDHNQDPFLRYISRKIIATYQGRVEAAKNQSEAARAFRVNMLEKFKEMVPQMHEAGVTILAGSDAGAYNSYVYPGEGLHGELQLLSEVGLTNQQVLEIATMEGPLFFEKENLFGAVQTSKYGDILVLNTNPLEDIKNLQDIFGVSFGSNFMTRDYLDGLLERVRGQDFGGV